MNALGNRVVMFHTAYSAPGGEDLSVAMDTALLRQRGFDVIEYRARNTRGLSDAPFEAAGALWRSHFNRRVYESVRAFCREQRPTIAHVQNFWYALSPSVHAACHAEGVPTVQTLRNYRLLCANGLLMREGAPCEACVGRTPWRGVLHACYRSSRASSALVARMIVYNRRRRTWHDDVDLFVALTPFARDRHVAGGLPGDRIAVKPNSVVDPGAARQLGTGAAFVGRLSPEKGLDVLLTAWAGLRDVPLVIAGDGPLRADVNRAAAQSPQIRFMGQVSNDQCLESIRRSAMLVMTSRWYEGFPRVIVEAFAVGRPVVAPRLGSMRDLVRDGVNGLLYEPGSAADLRRCVRAISDDRSRALEMAQAARAEYERLYTPETNGEQLIEIYERATSHRQSSGKGRTPASCNAT